MFAFPNFGIYRYRLTPVSLAEPRFAVLPPLLWKPNLTIGGVAYKSIDDRSNQWRSGRRGVGELNGRCDPAPGVGAVVIAISREFVDTGAALLKRFVAVALQH